jgi:hypothetical protein
LDFKVISHGSYDPFASLPFEAKSLTLIPRFKVVGQKKNREMALT